MTDKGKHVPYTKMDTKTNTVTKLNLIAKRAYDDKKLKFTSLIHHLNNKFLKECYQLLKRGKAAGVDGRTVESYSEEEISQLIEETIKQMKKRKYESQSVRRVYIEKTDGGKRSLGIPTVIDKVVQLGVTRVLEAIYEQDFLSVSFGYRPAKDAHDCLKEVNHMIMGKKINWIIEADIKGFFDNIDHGWMMRCLEERIADPNLKRLIYKFLKAGVKEKAKSWETEKGIPQGGIISPILANIYLHYVLDLWFEKGMKKKLKGYIQLIRYADDFVIGVQYLKEAELIINHLKERLRKFGLKLAQDKTRVIEFGRFAQENRSRQEERKPQTFNFLGFTHYCSQTRDGRFQLRIKTERSRFNKASILLNKWLKAARNNLKTKLIWEKIKSKLIGHYNYYGVSGNFESINSYYHKTRRLVFKWMNRRNRKRRFNWEGFGKYLLLYPFPKPKLTYVIYNTW